MQKIINGDCLEEMKNIKEGSIDLILVDPPYGTIKGIRNSPASKTTGLKENLWDSNIKSKDIFDNSNRVLRKNGKLIIFSQEPYTSKLIVEAIPNLQFCYRMVWKKNHFANCLLAKKAPVSYFEDILVFSKMNPLHDSEFMHPLRPYFKKVFEFIGSTKKYIVEQVGQGADHTFRYGSSQFSLCTEETYDKLIEFFKISNMEGFIKFDKLKEIDSPFKSSHNEELNKINPAIFNLSENEKIKSNILEYKKDYGGLHPTQKPVELLRDLIRTYSNEGDTILDFTAGSFSTLVACQKENRNGIGIELDNKFCEIGRERLKQTSFNVHITSQRDKKDKSIPLEQDSKEALL